MSNVDQAEIKKFAEHANDWWDPKGSMKALHDINPLRVQFIQECVDIAGKRVLDVGCGGGIVSEALAREDAIVTGLDMAEQSIAVAQQHAESNKLDIKYLCCTVEDLLEHDAKQKYDVITCLEMLEHVPDPEAIVTTIGALLAPNGHAIFSTINRNLQSYLCAIIGAEYILNLVPKGTHDYAKLIKPSELDAWARKADLQIHRTMGIGYNPFTGRFYLTPDISINYLAYYRKNGGWVKS